MRLGTGAIIEFVKSSDEPLELLINNKVIGVGETVKVGENFGLRITQIGDVKQIIASLGGGDVAAALTPPRPASAHILAPPAPAPRSFVVTRPSSCASYARPAPA